MRLRHELKKEGKIRVKVRVKERALREAFKAGLAPVVLFSMVTIDRAVPKEEGSECFNKGSLARPDRKASQNR